MMCPLEVMPDDQPEPVNEISNFRSLGDMAYDNPAELSMVGVAYKMYVINRSCVWLCFFFVNRKKESVTN